MALPENQLIIKRSTLPNAGKGLFTKVDIPKGARIVQYTGDIKAWKEVTENPVFNAYVFYVNRNHVIDAKDNKKSIARYINDAKGPNNPDGLKNNCKYEIDGLKVYVIAMRNIPAGSELLVSYGRDYWKAIRHNQTLEQ